MLHHPYVSVHMHHFRKYITCYIHEYVQTNDDIPRQMASSKLMRQLLMNKMCKLISYDLIHVPQKRIHEILQTNKTIPKEIDVLKWGLVDFCEQS